jgi:DNA polymerase
MNDDLLNKLSNFLSSYKDLYGEQLFVDDRRIHKLIGELAIPKVRMKSEKEKRMKPVVSDKSASPLWDFMREIKDCQKCGLHKHRTNFVFGDGSADADIMFVGEAPGAEEDRTGIPFVGRAGKLLNKLLTHIQMKREDVFIANILKSRPPSNRDPQPEEIEACISYLHRQIELIQPKLLVALGRVSAQNLLKSTLPLKQMRGRLWQYRGVDMLVTYHPAAILRNMGLMDTAIKDFKFIREKYQQILHHQPEK